MSFETEQYDEYTGDAVERSQAARDQAVEAAQVLGQEVPNATTRRAERVSWRIAIVIGILSTAIALAGVRIAQGAAEDVAAIAVDRKSLEEDQRREAQTVQQAIDQLRASNAALEARGQAPVDTPPAPSLDEALVAAATARVLAQLPAVPSESDIRSQVAAAVALIPPAGPSDAQIRSAVNVYLAANPPPQGPQGERGQQGEAGQDGNDGVDGQDGTNGTNGVNGANGQDGLPGEPPVSWTFIVGTDTYECQRVADFDLTTPRYECTVIP